MGMMVKGYISRGGWGKNLVMTRGTRVDTFFSFKNAGAFIKQSFTFFT